MAKKNLSILIPLLALLTFRTEALVVPHGKAFAMAEKAYRTKNLSLMNAALATVSPDEVNEPTKLSKKLQMVSQIRQEGGLFAFNTKFGALNPYAIWYGVTSIVLGLFWFVALIGCELLYKVSSGKVDKLKRLPTFFSQMWGESLIKVAMVQPEIVGKDILERFYKMYVRFSNLGCGELEMLQLFEK